MIPFILDASVVAKLAVVEQGTAQFRQWFEEHSAEEFHGPAVLYSEVGRVLQKALPGSKPKELAELHEHALRPVRLQQPSGAESHHVWVVAQSLQFYDAEYVRLAQRLGGVLVTADRKMAERARKHGVQVKEF